MRIGHTLAVVPGPWFMRSVAFSRDGHYLAVSSRNGPRTVSVYQLVGRRERRWLVGHIRGTQCLAFHPRLDRLASGADDRAIIIWDTESASPSRRWVAYDVYVSGLAFSPDGSLLASSAGDGSGSQGGQIRVWDAETGSLRRDLIGHKDAVHALAFDSTGRRLATGDSQGIVIIWDTATGKMLRRETVGASALWSIAFLEEDQRFVTKFGERPDRLN